MAGQNKERRESRRRQQATWLVAAGLLLLACPARAQQPADFFRQNCMSCHTIGGGRLTGPDLKNVPQRKDRAWLERFIQNPKAMIDRSDSYALQLQQEARGVVMPTVPGMTPTMAKTMLDFIDAESKLAKSQFAGITISDRPFTAVDFAAGRGFFLGVRPLANGGPACISCHTLGTLGGLGGGRLAPDLTRVYERLGGRKSVGTWLSAPATPTMQAVFRGRPLQPEEILPLLATFEDAASQGREADSNALLNFFLLGFSGMVVGLVVMGAVWRGRFQAVRRPLVRGRRRGER
jgi:mono/diheme cytochrome c family protein